MYFLSTRSVSRKFRIGRVQFLKALIYGGDTARKTIPVLWLNESSFCGREHRFWLFKPSRIGDAFPLVTKLQFGNAYVGEVPLRER